MDLRTKRDVMRLFSCGGARARKALGDYEGLMIMFEPLLILPAGRL
jgi:hypothetical protein